MSSEVSAQLSLPENTRIQTSRLLQRGEFCHVFEGVMTDQNGQKPVVIIRYVLDLPLAPEHQDEYYRAWDEVIILRALGGSPQVLVWQEVGEGSRRTVNLVMEKIEGENLRERLHAPIKGHEAARIMSSVLERLVEAHSQDIVHADIKPGNVLLQRDGRALLFDWNSAFPLSDAHQMTLGRFPTTIIPPELIDLASMVSISLDTADSIRLLCELSVEGHVGFYTDIYQAGVTLYKILVQNKEFSDDNPIRNKDVLRKYKVPVGLQDIIFKATTLDPLKRYHDAMEMKTALDKWLLSQKGIRRFIPQ